MALPLLSLGGGDAIHDWHYLLSHLGMLSLDTAIAALLRLVAFLLLWGSIVAGGWICWLMFRSDRSAPTDLLR